MVEPETDPTTPILLPREQWQGTRPEYLHRCVECNGRFIAAKHAKVCSDRCEAARYRKRRRQALPARPCPICNEDYVPKRQTQTVCYKPRCRELHYRRNTRNAPKEIQTDDRPGQDPRTT